MSKLVDRDLYWDTLSRKSGAWDVVIIGAGITGIGILYQAALHGLTAVLFEQKDFAWGSSSRTSKMIHGGLRYITQGDIKLTRQSVQERDRLLKAAPGLVQAMDFLFPLRKGQQPGKVVFNSILAIYDKFAGIRSHGYLSEQELRQRIPALNPHNLRGASFYTDAITDDARLVLRVLHSALNLGALAGNYMQVQNLLFDEHDNVTGVQVNNITTGQSLSVHANAVVNATGAWMDSLREPVTGERTIRPLRGSHIVIPRELAPINDALTLFHPRDKRTVFIVPWEQCTVVGTTDLDHKSNLFIEPGITTEELSYLIELVRLQFPNSEISPEKIISTYAGVRPIVSKDRSKSPSREKRGHKVWLDRGLISVSGGKLTTYRVIALEVVKILLNQLDSKITIDLNSPPLQSTSLTDKTLKDVIRNLETSDLTARLIGSYGNHAVDIAKISSDDELKPLHNSRFCLAELRWSARHEAVVHLDDLLLRRTRLGLVIPDGGASELEKIKIICQQELGWSDAIWDAEKRRYLNLWEKHYSIPRTGL